MACYLVTGGCGFIGSHLVDHLISKGHTVQILDNLSSGKRDNLNKDAELIVGDVRDIKTVTNAMVNMNGVFHLAAVASVQESITDWIGTHQINLTGAINIFDAARADIIPVVYASSAAVYGDNIDVPLCESSYTLPLSAYGADKLGCELHGFVAREVHELPTLGLRFFNVYGPRQDPKSPYSGVISCFSDRLVAGRDLIIHGKGSQSRDFIYVVDIVNALTKGMKALDKKGLATPIVVNACTGKRTTILQLAQTMIKIWDADVNIEYQDSRVGDIHTSLGDPSYAYKTLNFSAKTQLHQGLKRLCRSKKIVSAKKVVVLHSSTYA